MMIRRTFNNDQLPVELVDESGHPVAIVSAFLRHLAARECSPNTLIAYAHDLQHLWRFLAKQHVAWDAFRPPHALALLEYLRTASNARSVQRLGLTLTTTRQDQPATRLAPETINRILAAVSSFYEYAILSDQLDCDNPIAQRPDPHRQRVPDRHRPFMDGASQQRPVRRSVRVKTVQRLPRPMSDEHVAALLAALRCQRDRALIRLMLDGGLRPGETLGLHLDDIAYGRRRVVIRHRNDHPKGVRAKSRTERVVDLYEPATLAAVNTYVITERPVEADNPFVFLVGGHGHRRLEPLSYPALAKLFARACERAGIRQPWMTPHSLRHTHATRMWEGGMRELSLQKRLGHASPESTRLYTRVSEPAVVADYRRALGMETAPTPPMDEPGQRS
jgi:site-specific recombinase XerD